MSKTVEYRVRPVTRYIVTEFISDPENGAGHCGTIGEYDNEWYAQRVKLALESHQGEADSPNLPPWPKLEPIEK